VFLHSGNRQRLLRSFGKTQNDLRFEIPNSPLYKSLWDQLKLSKNAPGVFVFLHSCTNPCGTS
ncbi:hypothetical protein, partial [Rheinheimera sp.]|uniref:hypothetical protein n=1 Tax=Rheinheimera sp. TaxID=1869214 RepID=UPI002FDD0517